MRWEHKIYYSEDFSMMEKEKLDKQLKKGQQITVYAQGNIPA